ASPRARQQAATEIRAQLEVFRRTGLRLDHVDGHHHFHQHPVVQRILLALASEFGIRAMRLPAEPALRSWRATRSGALRRIGNALLAGTRLWAMRRRLRRAGLACNDAMLGLADTGQMTPSRLRQLLTALPEGVTELYVHPATRRWSGADAFPATYAPEAEFAALLDPEVKAAIAASGASLTT